MPGGPRAWKKRAGTAARIAAWGALGTGISFLVSIACVLRAEASPRRWVRAVGSLPLEWLWAARAGWAGPNEGYAWRSTVAELDERVWVRATPGRSEAVGLQQEYRAGWPLRGWRWRRDWSPADPEPRALLETATFRLDRGFAGLYWVAGPSAVSPMPHIVTFPLAPNGWAFAGSVALYGGAAWGLRRGVAAVWGWRRCGGGGGSGGGGGWGAAAGVSTRSRGWGDVRSASGRLIERC